MILGIVLGPLIVLFFALPFLLRLYARVSGKAEIAELVEADVG